MQIDVDRLIDERPISAVQIRVFVFCALVALLDAVDSQAIGPAAPLMAEAFKVSPASFSWVFSAALFGAAIGAFAFGPISDRFGRRPLLIFSVALFGIFTLVTTQANSFSELLAFRFIAGLGLGGATPCFITMAAEFAPARLRSTLVSFLWAGYPLGNSVGGFLTSYLISHYHWSMVFYAGGVPTLILALLVILFMPESLRFLALRKDARAESLVRQLAPDLPPGELQIVIKRQAPRSKVPFVELFTHGRAAGSILIALALFFGFACTTIMVQQVPTLLRQIGVPLGTAAFLTALYSTGSTISMAMAGWLVARFGATRALVPPFVLGAVLMTTLGFVATAPYASMVVAAALGFTFSLGASGAIALAANFYPTAMRSAGTGWVMAMGRFGQVCSPLAIGAMLALAWAPGKILIAMSLASLAGGVCILLKSWLMPGHAGAPAAAIEKPA